MSAFELEQFADSESKLDRAAPLRFDSVDHRLSDTQRIVSLSMVSSLLNKILLLKVTTPCESQNVNGRFVPNFLF